MNESPEARRLREQIAYAIADAIEVERERIIECIRIVSSEGGADAKTLYKFRRLADLLSGE